MRTHVSLLLCSLPLLMAACSDNPVEPEDHEEASGFALLVNGLEVVRHTSGSTADTLFLSQGETGPLFDVRFIAGDSTLFVPDEEGHSLGVAIADEAIVGVATLEPGAWQFSIEGISSGETTLELLLMHGGHSDFRSDPLVVVVTP